MAIFFVFNLVVALWIVCGIWDANRPSFVRDTLMSGVVSVVATLFVYSEFPTWWVRWFGMPAFMAICMLPIGFFSRTFKRLRDAGRPPTE